MALTRTIADKLPYVLTNSLYRAGIACAIKTSSYTAAYGDGIFADTSTGAFTISLPLTGTLGDTIYIHDVAGTFDVYNLTVDRNGNNINGVAENLICTLKNASYKFMYGNVTYGWVCTMDRIELTYD